MKTIYLRVDVPDYFVIDKDIDLMDYANHYIEFTEIQLPSEDEIMKKYPFNNEAAEVNAYRREGATWLLNKMKGE